MPPAWRRYARFLRPNVVQDVDDEIAHHLAARTDELIAHGVAAGRAAEQAREEFGQLDRHRRNIRRIAEQRVRRGARLEWLDGIAHDVRIAFRGLRAAPGVAAAVIATLGLGIGLTAAIFSVVNAYLFRPLPVADPDRLVALGASSPALRQPHEMSLPDLRDLRELTDVFAGVTAFINQSANVGTGDGRAERAMFEEATANYFDVVGVRAAIGRTFLPHEDRVPGGHRVAVLAHGYWQRRFGGDPAVVGRHMRVNGLDFEIVGVLPASFDGVQSLLTTDAYTPLNQIDDWTGLAESRQNEFLNVFARLQPGVTLEAARARVTQRAAQVAAAEPATNREVRWVVVPERHARPLITIAEHTPTFSLVFLTLAGLVLTIACANVAGLLLARSAARERELAIRAALGAGRGRLIRLALVESLLLAGLGALAALAVALWTTGFLRSLRVATDAPVRFPVEPDWRVFAFTLTVAVAAGVLAGLMPALRGARVDPFGALRDGGRGGHSPARQRMRAALVMAQVTVSLVVLIAAGLFVRSLQRAASLDLGFRREGVVMATASTADQGYDAARAARFWNDLAERTRAIPGVREVAWARSVPLGYNNSTSTVYPDGGMPGGVADDHLVSFGNHVSPEYFGVLGVRIEQGRGFAASDDTTAPRVAIVNAELARQLWPGQDAVGRIIRRAPQDSAVLVIGVAANATWLWLRESPRPFIYWPMAQRPTGTRTLLVRSDGASEPVIAGLRSAAAELDPDLPLFDVRTMDAHLKDGRALFSQRIAAQFAAFFGLLALVLAAVGLYGLVAFGVQQRTQEIGVRVALGADAGAILRLVLRQGLAIVLTGVVAGVALALLAGRGAASLLVGIGAGDPPTYIAVTLLLVVVATAACLVPARRALRVPPMTALRSD